MTERWPDQGKRLRGILTQFSRTRVPVDSSDRERTWRTQVEEKPKQGAAVYGKAIMELVLYSDANGRPDAGAVGLSVAHLTPDGQPLNGKNSRALHDLNIRIVDTPEGTTEVYGDRLVMCPGAKVPERLDYELLNENEVRDVIDEVKRLQQGYDGLTDQ